MRILFVGDVVGEPGMRAVEAAVPRLRDLLEADFVLANGENSHPSGRGITEVECDRLLNSGIDCITGGNHSFAQRASAAIHQRERHLLRPLNFPHERDTPGHGRGIFEAGEYRVAVINLIGQALIGAYDNPFHAADREVEILRASAPIILVDFHAETTSEKIALGWHLEGRVAAMVGTHTHVATADARVLPGGTAYITDLGMTGPHESVIGVRREIIIDRLTKLLPARHLVASRDVRLCGALADVDPATGRATFIERLEIPFPDERPDFAQAEHLAARIG